MTNEPNPAPPIEYRGLASPPARPGVVTAAGVVGIVLASMSLLCNVIGAIAITVNLVKQSTTAVPQPTWMIAVSITVQLISFLLAVTWIIISINLIRLASHARRHGVVLAKVHLAFLAATLVFSLATASATSALVEKQLAANRANGSASMSPTASHSYSLGAAYGGPIVGAMFAAILPGVMLILLSQSAAIGAFKESAKDGQLYSTT